MAKIITKNSFTSGTSPSGLSAGELAVNVVDKKLFVGNAVESAITLIDGNNIVTSINGTTGANYIVGGRGVTLIKSGNTYYPEIFYNAAGPTGLTFATITKVQTTDKILIQQAGAGTPMKLIEASKFINSPVFADVTTIPGPLGSYDFAFFDGIYEPYKASGTTVRSYLFGDGVVTSVNGATGAITDVAKTNIGQTFTIPTAQPNITFRRDNYFGSDSATIRFIAVDPTNTIEYKSDIRGNSNASGDTTHTLPDTTGTLLNSNFNSYVSSYNGRTGAIQGVSAASAGTGISVSGATGEVTITNTGVLSFNGSTGAVQGVASVNGLTGAVSITYASAATITSSNVNATRYITFVGGTGNTGFFIDDVTTPLSYNPQQGNISAKKLTLTTGSNIVTVDSTGNTVTLTDGSNVSSFGLESFASSNSIPFELSAAVGLTLTSSSGGIAMSGSGYYYKFPESNGTNGHILTTNGSGSLSWGTTVAGISASAGICGGAHVRSEGGYRLGTSALNARTGTTYTLLSTDDGKIITSANAATQTITIPSGLPVGFNCTIIQLGTGGVGITSGFSATLASYQNKFNIVGQYAAATVVSYSSDIFVLVGGLTG